jgi:type II secretion system protein N
MRRVVRYLGIALLGLVTFVFALQLSLPVERAKAKFIEAVSPSYDVSFEVERGIMPGRLYLKSVQLVSRPTKPDETATTIFIEKVQVDIGLFAALRGNLALDLQATIGSGKLVASVSLPGFGKNGLTVQASGHDLDGQALPLRGIIGLPMTGKLDLEVDLELPRESRNGVLAANWQKASGSFEFGCPSGCTFGDGKTKLKPILKNRGSQVMVQDGIPFGTLQIDSLAAHAEIKDGVFTVSKFETASRDGELHIDYSMKLEPDIMDSNVTGCLRFKGTDALLKRDRNTYNAITLTGAELRSDGLYHITLADSLRQMRRLNQECGPNVKHPPAGSPSHPTIAVMPDTPPTPPIIKEAAPPPPPPPADAGVAHPPGPEGEVPAPSGSAASGAEGSAGGAAGAGGSARPGEVLQRQ